MNSPIQFKTTTPILFIALMLGCFGFLPEARATDLDGVLPNGNTADGSGVLVGLTTGLNNSGFGYQALNHDTTGNGNTATGYQALYNNTTGTTRNTANGVQALYSNTTGSNNVAIGWGALYSNTIGIFNTANGSQALYHNTDGGSNVATGYQALSSNTRGSGNTANGAFALSANITGIGSTATGFRALESNTADFNTADGFQALLGNTTGTNNTAIGFTALYQNTTGSRNTAIGDSALANSNGKGNANSNTAVGYQALNSLTTGGNNTAIGKGALSNMSVGNFNIALGSGAGFTLTHGGNNIYINSTGAATEHDTIRIGIFQTSTFIAGIYGATASGGYPVYVNSDGQLATSPSSARFKQKIQDMGDASKILLSLRPVTFSYKPEIDPQGSPQFGLVAEEVEKIAPDLVGRDAEGRIYTVRYEAVNAMLLNEFIKEHRKVQEQEATITQLKKEMETVVVRLKAQDSEIQKVSDQVELSKAAARVVASDP